jgi:hypothetical protein
MDSQQRTAELSKEMDELQVQFFNPERIVIVQPGVGAPAATQGQRPKQIH